MVVNPTMLGQADFTRTTGGDAFFAELHCILQAAQRVTVQFGGGEALVAGEAAAMDALG